MQAELRKYVVGVVELNDLAARRGAEAVAVGNYERAAVFNELGEHGIVDLAADDGNTGAVPGLCIDLALFDLGKRLAQVRQDKRLRAGVGDQIENVVLVAGDGRIFHLAHLADLGKDAADFVVLLHGLAQRLVRRVRAELFLHNIEHTIAHLLHIGLERVVGNLEGNVRVGHEEVGLVVYLQDFKVLHSAVHHGAGVHADHGVQKLVAALDGALGERSGELAGVVRHVVRCNVDGAGVRSAETDGEAVANVEDRFGDMVAGVPHGQIPFRGCLSHKLVVGIIQKLLKVDQMLEILQMSHPFLISFSCCLPFIYKFNCAPFRECRTFPELPSFRGTRSTPAEDRTPFSPGCRWRHGNRPTRYRKESQRPES